MKPQSIAFIFTIIVIAMLQGNTASAQQQYKMRQSSTMSGMKSETTIYVKGPRKRTEGGGYRGMGGNIVTIEQCDLQRTIKINDKKKLYYIEPFNNIEEEEETKPAPKSKPVPAVNKEPKEKVKGGIITTYYNITDTGERKKMYGFTARHVWTTQKIKPSADACMMKDSMVIKTDGWYIDLPQFNCPVTSYGRPAASYNKPQQPQCEDRFVSKRSGKGKLGFPLIETKTMIMGGTMQTSEFQTSLETLELSTAKLDSMLFEIPIGYTQTTNEEDLQDKIDPAQYMQQAKQYSQAPKEEKASGMIRIGIYEPTGEESLKASVLQQHLVSTLSNDKVEAIAVSSQEDAQKFNCDFVLMTEFTRVKQGSKAGSLFKALKNTDPSAATSFNIEANLSLLSFPDGTTRAQEKVDGKFDGKVDEAAKKALEKGSGRILKELR